MRQEQIESASREADEFFAKVKALSDRIAYIKLVGIELLDAKPGWVRMKLAFRPELLQPLVIHGGAVYSLADAAAAHAMLTMVVDDPAITTVEQRINFIRGINDRDLYCEAQIVHFGRTLSYADATVTTADGKLVAKSTATLMRLNSRD